MLHLVCGDLAQVVLQQALGPQARIQVLRDDLAIGPLRDIQTPPCTARVAFWAGLWPHAWLAPPDFAGDLAADARGLARLDETVTVWHGDSCSEQLLLTRVAAALAQRSQPIWEVACGQLPQWPRRTVSLCAPALLATLHQQRRLLTRERCAQLADTWRQQCLANAEVRLWQGGGFHGQSFDSIDQALLAACAEPGQLAAAMARVMADSRGFFPTDLLLLWRARELERRGLLRLSGEPGEYAYRGLWVESIAG